MSRADSSKNSFRCNEDLSTQVIPAHALGIGHRVDLAQYLDELGSLLGVLRGTHNDPASGLFLLLNLGKHLVIVNCFSYETSCVCLNQHELQNVNLLVSNPGLVEVVQVFSHVFDDVLDSDVHGVFDNSFVQVPDDVLDHSKLLK